MNKIKKILFSFPLMGVVLLIFAVSIAFATFIERDYGTSTARAVIYNAKWFEVLLFIGIINITGIIITHKLYRREKLTLFFFHLAFVIILIGSAITRYFGAEGVMHIREGETTNQVISQTNYFYATAEENKLKAEASKEIVFSSFSKNYTALNMHLNNKKIKVECTEIVPNAVEMAKEIPGGVPVLELVIAGMSEEMQQIVIESGKSKRIGMLTISFNDTSNLHGISIVKNDTGFVFRSPFEMEIISMTDQRRDSLEFGVWNHFKIRELYNIHGIKLIAKQYYPSAEIDVMSMPHENKVELSDALRLKVTVGDKTRKLLYFASKNALNHTLSLTMENVLLKIGYGSKTLELPFSLKLDTFILARYPGSNSPSWYESKITLIDSAKNINEKRRIYMNNVLKYSGYRFYQSNYDEDEKGTVLSVNKDFWGTFVTYIGYILMALGMFVSLFNAKSHFLTLLRKTGELREKRKNIRAGIILLLIMFSFSGVQAQSVPDSVIIPEAHAKLFGKVLVQVNGRFKPINSFSSELVRKITRKSQFAGMNNDQVLLGMLVYPDFWKSVPMIKASHAEILRLLNSDNNLVAFNNLFSQENHGEYILRASVEEAVNKSPKQRSKFESELIRFDERVYLSYFIYTREFLKIFPHPQDKAGTWYNYKAENDYIPDDMGINVSKTINEYIDAVQLAMKTGKWENPNKIVESIIEEQKTNGGSLVPSAGKVKAELLYNKLDIFQRLANILGLVGFILLVCQFIGEFKSNFKMNVINKAGLILIIFLFGLYTFGLGLRWYVSGHAPWSDGYESMIYIGWAVIFSGLLFSRKLEIALSASAILAWNILHVAHLSWMDPVITNLVPVLKSFWLEIHVAIIAFSYALLGLGALLAFVNLVFMTTQNEKNYNYIGLTIKQFTAVIEMMLIVGLYLLTIGTFIGGVWANESWGRYWGWDSKETWALVTVLWYALLTHLRLIPGFKSGLLFNSLAMLSFFTVIMTYFGVNYLLQGLHSYAAKGETATVIPAAFYYTLGVMLIVIFLAVVKQKMVLKREEID